MTKAPKMTAAPAASAPANENRSLVQSQSKAVTDYRTITAVRDISLPDGLQVRTVQSVLDPLTALGLAQLRTQVHQAHAQGASRFLCAYCNSPVYLAGRPAGPEVPRDGRGAFFKHYSNPDAPPCPHRTDNNLHDVGAQQFCGQQEGSTHETLKHALAECLSQDPRFFEVQVEKRVTSTDGSWRVPDVSAVFADQLIAFDLQLATLPIATILERDKFYLANSVHHVWLTDAANLSRLTQQAFCDLHLNSGGRIFAIDDVSIEASSSSGQFQLKELTIVPRLVPERPLHNIWDARLVGTETILINPEQRRREGEQGYRKALASLVSTDLGQHRQAIRHAAAVGDNLFPVAQHWRGLAQGIRGSGYDAALADDLGAVLAVLAQAEIYVGATPSDRAPQQKELQQRLHRLLGGRHGLHWAPLVALVFDAVPSIRDAGGAACHARLNALLASPEKVFPFVRHHAGMLSALFTWLGFRLLIKAPKFTPNMRVSAPGT